jgi:hypothetical protein
LLLEDVDIERMGVQRIDIHTAFWAVFSCCIRYLDFGRFAIVKRSVTYFAGRASKEDWCINTLGDVHSVVRMDMARLLRE